LISEDQICEGAQMLPYVARDLLMRAAKTHIPEFDPLARERAINAAIRSVKLLYPTKFREETE